MNPASLEPRHPLHSEGNNKIIVKFFWRKDAESILIKRKKLKGFNLRSMDIDSGRIYVNESLCLYHKFLWSKCKQICSKEKNESFRVNNGHQKIRVELEGAVSLMSHISDLVILFPEFDFQVK